LAKTTREKLYLGVDVGGTKILAALVRPCGTVVARQRCDTPSQAAPKESLKAIRAAMRGALAAGGARPADLAAIGLAVPGVVDPDRGRVVVTPNMNLTGMAIRAAIRRSYRVPVAVGNDVNLGTLGERWLGAARGAASVVGIFVGTGIGGGVIVDGRLVRGAREAAGEIGHIVMLPGGPRCGCGNRGCLEALASRSAIERELRKAIAAGRRTVLRRLGGKARGKGPIKSRALRRALKARDPVVVEVMHRAAEFLGYACLTVRHLVDPDVIVLGGGVMEACGDFVLPIVQKIVAADALPGARRGGEVVQSTLGDDAVALGAVAIAQELVGESPLARS
jgi:glucokinase